MLVQRIHQPICKKNRTRSIYSKALYRHRTKTEPQPPAPNQPVGLISSAHPPTKTKTNNPLRSPNTHATKNKTLLRNRLMRWYVIMQITSMSMVAFAVCISLLFPGPAIDAPWPYYWPMLRDIETGMVFVGAMIMWLAAAHQFVFQTVCITWHTVVFIFLPMITGLCFSAFILALYCI